MRNVIAPLLLLASISFGLGISLPIVQFKKLYFFEENPSIISLIKGLWTDGSMAIAIAILLFSILFPIIKLTIVFMAAYAPASMIARSGSARLASALAKWSMMDVLLVALVIFAAKTSGIATAFAQVGIWFYGMSAISGALASSLLSVEQRKIAQGDLYEGKRVPGSKD